MHGSGNLIETLFRTDLVDEYRLWIFPVLLGYGKRLFSDGTVPARREARRQQGLHDGVVIGTYQPAGPVVTGSFAPYRDRKRRPRPL